MRVSGEEHRKGTQRAEIHAQESEAPRPQAEGARGQEASGQSSWEGEAEGS